MFIIKLLFVLSVSFAQQNNGMNLTKLDTHHGPIGPDINPELDPSDGIYK